MLYHVYKITNLISGKCYIGKTKQLKKRWYNHCRGTNKDSYISKAIKKYGKENFKFEVIISSDDENFIGEQEFFYIKEMNSLAPNGYNLTDKTDGKLSFHENHKNKISSIKQGIKSSKKSSSKFVGVVAVTTKHCITYMCCVRIDKKVVNRNYKTELEAAETYDKLVVYIYGPSAKVNFPKKLEEYLNLDLKVFYNNFLDKKKTSSYTGVDWIKKHNKWRARISKRPDTNKEFSLGFFDSEEEAAEVRDMAVIYFKIQSKLNFPDKVKEYLKTDIEKIIKDIEQSNIKSSKHEGVSKYKNNFWRAYCYKGKKHIHIGIFKSEEEAFNARSKFLQQIS